MPAGIYERKYKPIEDRYWEKVDKRSEFECWEWTAALDTHGYGHIQRKGRTGGLVLSHRLAWELQNGDIPEEMHVLHTCDNRKCCNPDHLFLGDNQINVTDKMRKGRFKPNLGEQNGSAKLTEEQVKLIRRYCKLPKGRFTWDTIAKLFGVAQSNISAIHNRRTWQHI